MSFPQYHLTKIHALYKDRLALEVDEMSIPSGRLQVLTGPNGSGKSTLLSILAFLKRPDCGELEFAGTTVDWGRKQLSSLRKRVTLLHQDSYLFSGSVFANVAFGPRARGARSEDVQQSVQESLAMVRLAGFELRNARQLSGGEARRVAIARALACNPEVLLLDEPMAHVDKESGEIIEGLIGSLVQRGMTVVMASHDEQIGDHLECSIAKLSEGKIVQTIERTGEPPKGGYCYAGL